MTQSYLTAKHIELSDPRPKFSLEFVGLFDETHKTGPESDRGVAVTIRIVGRRKDRNGPYIDFTRPGHGQRPHSVSWSQSHPPGPWVRCLVLWYRHLSQENSISTEPDVVIERVGLRLQLQRADASPRESPPAKVISSKSQHSDTGDYSSWWIEGSTLPASYRPEPERAIFSQILRGYLRELPDS